MTSWRKGKNAQWFCNAKVIHSTSYTPDLEEPLFLETQMKPVIKYGIYRLTHRKLPGKNG